MLRNIRLTLYPLFLSRRAPPSVEYIVARVRRTRSTGQPRHALPPLALFPNTALCHHEQRDRESLVPRAQRLCPTLLSAYFRILLYS